jgi:hypothetical protein
LEATVVVETKFGYILTWVRVLPAIGGSIKIATCYLNNDLFGLRTAMPSISLVILWKKPHNSMAANAPNVLGC